MAVEKDLLHPLNVWAKNMKFITVAVLSPLSILGRGGQPGQPLAQVISDFTKKSLQLPPHFFSLFDLLYCIGLGSQEFIHPGPCKNQSFCNDADENWKILLFKPQLATGESLKEYLSTNSKALKLNRFHEFAFYLLRITLPSFDCI